MRRVGDSTRFNGCSGVLFAYSAITVAAGKGIIGWLKDEAGDISPENFVDNREFNALLQQVVKSSVAADPELKHQAMLLKDGWMHVTDRRITAMANR